MITIRFVTGHDAVSEGIRRFCYGFWATHAEALMPDGTLLGAHADGGVQARAHDYDAGSFTRDMFVQIPATPEQADSFHAFMRSQIGKSYDFIAIASIVIERDWQDTDRWFCSELVAAALSHCGIFPPQLATEFNRITPRDLLLILSGHFALAA